MYHRPAKQSARYTLDTPRGSRFKDIGNRSMIPFCHMKQLTSFSKCLHFNALNSIIWTSVSCVTYMCRYEHSLTYSKNHLFEFFFETQIKVATKVLRFQSPSLC